jgi:predicted enzyme related to lactoylglutathione lyase
MAEEAIGKAPEMPKHGEFCWSEIAVTDLTKCRQFYENLFGWQFKKSESTGESMEYLEFSSFGGDREDGALYQMSAEFFGGEIPPAHIAQYISVDNVDESLEKAKALGGSLVFGPYDIPNVGRMAVINDPTGATLSLITLSTK